MEPVEPTSQSQAQSDEYISEFDLTINGGAVKSYKNSQVAAFGDMLKLYLLCGIKIDGTHEIGFLVESVSSFALVRIPAVNKNNEQLNEDEARLIFRLDIKGR